MVRVCPWRYLPRNDYLSTHTHIRRPGFLSCLPGGIRATLPCLPSLGGRPPQKNRIAVSHQKTWNAFSSRLAVASLVACVLLTSCLASVASDAQCLAIRHVVPLATIADRLDMVGLGWGTGGAAYHAAVLALPRISGQHCQPPRSMSSVCVSPDVGVRPSRFVSPAGTAKARGAMCWRSCWHGLALQHHEPCGACAVGSGRDDLQELGSKDFIWQGVCSAKARRWA